MNPDLPYVVGFSHVLEIGPVKFSQIISLFGSAEAAWKAPVSDFRPLNFNEKILASLVEARRRIDVDREMVRLEKLKVMALTRDDPRYPRLLKEIYDPPFLLYVRGELKDEDGVALAVVGSRRMTAYGYSVIESLVPSLCSAGLTIVSGLAFGVDVTAHKTALAAGGRCLAVLASGVDKITPVTNTRMGEAIIEEKGGALLSEFPLGVEPQPFYFPRRNRIIAGLSLGVLVVEAAEKSGSLITARAALEQGREVFSVPASIFNSLGEGTNGLIRQGAKIVTKPSDILEELNLSQSQAAAKANEAFPLDEEELKILSLIAEEEIHVDDLIRISVLRPPQVSSALTLLEVKGKVKNIGGGYYRKVN